MCVAVTCAFLWNTVAFEVSWAHFTGFIRLRRMLLVTLPLLLFFSRSLLIFTFLLIFMLFWLLLGLVVEGWRTLVLSSPHDRVSRTWRGDPWRAKYCWSREDWRRLAEPLRHCYFLRVTISPVVTGVIADVRQCFERTRDVQHRKLLGAWCHATVWHRNCYSCLSSSIGGTELAINWGCCSLAGKVWYPRLFVGQRVDKVRSRSFLTKKK